MDEDDLRKFENITFVTKDYFRSIFDSVEGNTDYVKVYAPLLTYIERLVALCQKHKDMSNPLYVALIIELSTAESAIRELIKD